MSYSDTYWEDRGRGKVRQAFIDAKIDAAEIDVAMAVVEDVIEEVRWAATEQGRFEESFYHVCNPD
jgi:hypothetical protein